MNRPRRPSSLVSPLDHGAESALRAGTVAVKLRRLRVQQQRERILCGVASRDDGMGAGRSGITLADCEQALRDGMPAPRGAAFAATAADLTGHEPQPTQNGPHQQRGDDRDAKQQREYRQCHRGMPAGP